jgi:hypothetical protein
VFAIIGRNLSRTLVALIAVSLFACRSEQQVPVSTASVLEPSKQVYALGSQITAAGAVAEEAISESFRQGGEVFLSVDVTSASIDQDVEVEWLDSSGRVLAREQRHVPEGVRYVTFSTRPHKHGEHRAVVVINGRRVTELPFQVL